MNKADIVGSISRALANALHDHPLSSSECDRVAESIYHHLDYVGLRFYQVHSYTTRNVFFRDPTRDDYQDVK